MHIWHRHQPDDHLTAEAKRALFWTGAAMLAGGLLWLGR